LGALRNRAAPSAGARGRRRVEQRAA
jgi:hypothetical protein